MFAAAFGLEMGRETKEIGMLWCQAVQVTGTAMAAVTGTAGVQGLELSEEWQDEDFPGPLPEEDTQGPPRLMRRRLPAPELSLALERTEGAEHSPDASLDLNLDALETPSGSELEGPNAFEWEDELPCTWGLAEGLCPAGTRRVLDVEDEGGQRWRLFLGERLEQKVDLSAVEPYTRVLSHAGYHSGGLGAILLFAACHLPDSSIPQYDYVMEHLLRYIAGTLEVTVADRYVLVCLSGATARGQIPSFGWMKRCYQAVDRRLRKSLQAVIIVHPTWYIKALVALSRPFLSPTFSGKVRFATRLQELTQLIPLEPALIPEPVRRLEPGWDGCQDVLQ
ncbi:bcl-2/adenovirus E1B 19 kDa-interacting protein 2-like protein isoform X1 [Struthio camelus]|uniref:bcl-2/adenovirus E1B 19 kDa-interacting protein 2-like protein isoform X1 n=2 Tax=Struthio camelus TaxID=8801 RepID=UPI0036040C26